MPTPDPLLLEFASSRPDEVAEVISDFDVDDANEFISNLPADVAARVCARIPNRHLARLLETLPAEKVAAMLMEGEHGDTLTLASRTGERLYSRILASVSEASRPRLKRLFQYPQTLAALASPDFIVVQADTLCKSIAEELMNARHSGEVPIFVVDSHDRYRGIVNTQAVISIENGNRPVSSFMRHIKPLPGEMKAGSALNASQWVTASALAVVDLEQKVIGSISQEELSKVVTEIPDSETPGFDTVFSELATRYLDLCASVASLAFRNPGSRRDND